MLRVVFLGSEVQDFTVSLAQPERERDAQPVSRRLQGKPRATGRAPVSFIVRYHGVVLIIRNSSIRHRARGTRCSMFWGSCRHSAQRHTLRAA